MHIRGALYQAVCVKKYAAALCLQVTPLFDPLTAYSIKLLSTHAPHLPKP